MNHPQISNRRERLLERLDLVQERWEKAEETEEKARLGRQLDQIEDALVYLDMADADPAAHGYEQGV